mgnify:CR=1 FL=1
MNKPLKTQILYSILGVAILFGLWLLFYLVVRNEYLMPAPFNVLEKSFLLLLDIEFYSALLSTLLRVLISVVISLIIATALSLLSLFIRGFSDVLTPITACLRSLPTLAVLLLILTFTKRSFAPILVAIISLIPLAFTSINQYLTKLKTSTQPIFKVFEVPTKKQVRVYLKGVIPSVVKEFFNLTSFALKLIVSGEILANVYISIGRNIQQASIYSDTLLLTALTLFVCVLGIVLEIIGNVISSKMEAKYL